MLFYRENFNAAVTSPGSADLYDEIQRIHYRIGGRDEKLCLNIKISLNTRYGFADEKILKVIITDVDNPFVLFSTDIDSDAYSRFKQKLGLLIDFSQFPHQLVSLLSQCSNENVVSPKYTLALEEVDSDPYDLVDGRCILFRVMEVNQFQCLSLLALHMVCGSEREINSFMARNIHILKQQLQNMRIQMENAEQKAKKAFEDLSVNKIDVNRMKAQYLEQIKSVERECDKEVERLKHNSECLKSEYERNIKRAVEEQEEKHKSQSNKLQETVDRYKSEVYSQKNKINQLETELAERNNGLTKLHNDIKILQDEILKSEQMVTKFESESREKNVSIVSLKQRISHLEKEREEKDKDIKKLSSVLEAVELQKNMVTSSLKEKLQTIESQKSDLSILMKDLMKANEIISKMNTENKNFKRKLNERSKIILGQEKLIKDLRTNISSEKENNGIIKKLEEENGSLKMLLHEKEEVIKQKDDMIQKYEMRIGWLKDIVAKQGAKSSTNLTTQQIALERTLVDEKLLELTKKSTNSRKTSILNKKNHSVRQK